MQDYDGFECSRKSGDRWVFARSPGLDTLEPAKFPFLAGRPLEWHARIMEVMHELADQVAVMIRAAIAATAELTEEDYFQLKLNCVLLRGANEVWPQELDTLELG